MNEPEVKVLMLKGNDGAKTYYSQVEIVDNEQRLSMADLTPKADATNPPELGATIITPSGGVFAISAIHITPSTATYDVGKQLTSIKGPQGAKGEQGERGPQGLTGSLTNTKITPSYLSRTLFNSMNASVGYVSDNLSWYKNTHFSDDGSFYNLIEGGYSGKEFTAAAPTDDAPTQYLNDFNGQMIIPATKTTYTLSFEAKSTVNGDTIYSYFTNDDGGRVQTANGASTSSDGHVATKITNSYKRYSITYVIDPQSGDDVSLQAIPVSSEKNGANGATTGTITARNIRLAAGTDATYVSTQSSASLAVMSVTEGEIYYISGIRNGFNISGMNSRVVLVDRDYNPVKVFEGGYEDSITSVYSVEVPPNAMHMFINNDVPYGAKVIEQYTFLNVDRYISNIMDMLTNGKSPNITEDVVLTHVQDESCYWDSDKVAFVSSGEPLYQDVRACQPIDVVPYEAYIINGSDVGNAPVAMLVNYDGSLEEIVASNDEGGAKLNNVQVTIPTGVAFMLVNDNTVNGGSSTVKKVLNWK